MKPALLASGPTSDETTRVLVAASAIIPVFNFDHWEYSRLGEVLIYPGSFDHNYRTDGDDPASHAGHGRYGALKWRDDSLKAGPADRVRHHDR